MVPLSLYIHWPFCLSKCPYCDFNSHVREHIDESQWLESYLKDLKHHHNLLPNRELKSIFFGGGTPSLMRPQTVEKILEAIAQYWSFDKDIEITLEANPNTLEAGKFQSFRIAGINRVSIGIQSLKEDELKFLGRTHDARQAKYAIDDAQKNFDRFSFDLIYALPGHTPTIWEQNLKEALALAGDHLSLYQLTIEPNTAFFHQYGRGDFRLPTPPVAADLYEITQEIMETHGMPAYEISNHAKPGQESRHNTAYWRYNDYAGIGPGAHGRITLDGGTFATKEYRAPETWLKHVAQNGHGLEVFEEVTTEEKVIEIFLMGLRLQEGLPLTRLPGPLNDLIASKKITALIDEDLLTVNGTHIAVTPKGRVRLNGILEFLLA
jgi:oxygen-independent coproporphyrinogen-3 oxidase